MYGIAPFPASSPFSTFFLPYIELCAVVVVAHLDLVYIYLDVELGKNMDPVVDSRHVGRLTGSNR